VRFDREPLFLLHFRPLEKSADRRDPFLTRKQKSFVVPAGKFEKLLGLARCSSMAGS